jgi:predicted nucleic acid-binding protein
LAEGCQWQFCSARFPRYPARNRTRPPDVPQWQEAEIVAQLKLVARIAEIITPTVRLKVIAEDPTDDRILECALAGAADRIVSGDLHLRKLKSFRNIGIVPANDFLHTLGR